MNTREKGNVGEDIACEHLQKCGYQIACRNYIYRHKEIDIIAYHNNYIVFVEVKTRYSEQETIYESVNKNKRKHLISAADFYIQSNAIQNEARFDIVFVSFINGKVGVELIEDAFSPLAF